MKFPATLRLRLVLLVLAAMVPLFGFSIIKAVLNIDIAITRATDTLQLAAGLVGRNQQQVADTARQVLTAVASASDVRDGNAEHCNTYLAEVKGLFPAYTNLGVVSLDGYIRCHGLETRSPTYLGDRLYFREAVARRKFVAGEYAVGRLTGKPSVTFALPIWDAGERVSEVAYLAFDLVQMSMSIAETRLPTGAQLVILDRSGTVLAAEPGLRPEEIGKKLPIPLVQNALSLLSVGIFRGPDAAGKQRIFALQPSEPGPDAPFFVVLSIERDVVIAPAYRQLGLELLVLGLVAVLSGLLAWVIGGPMIVRPAREILSATQLMREGQFDVRIPIDRLGGGGEFASLANSINHMAEALAQREVDLQAELARSERSQRRLLDAQRFGRIGHTELDFATQRVFWSDEVHELFGLKPGAFDGRSDTVLQLVHPEDRAYYQQSREQAIRDRCELDIEYRIVTPANEVRWIHQVGNEQRGEDGVAIRRVGVMQEITARKNSELALVGVSDVLRRTGEIARIGGWELFLDGMRLVWSEQVYRIHELDGSSLPTLAEAIGFYAPEVRESIIAAVRASIDHGSPWDLEVPMVTATGRAIWARSQGQAVMEDGKVVRLVGTLQDITEQHRSRSHLRLLETSISRLNDIVLITETEPADEPGPRIVFVNDAFERSTGYSREEVLGKSPRLLQGPKTQRAQLDRISAAITKWEPVRAELINYKKSGEEFWNELDMVPIMDANGRYTHWVAVGRDISRRKLAEKAILESEQRYVALFEAAPVPMWVFDDATRQFTAVNEAAVNGYGFSAEEFLAMTVFDIHPEADYARLRERLAGPASLRNANWQHRRKDGSLFPVNVVSKSIQYGGRMARFVVALDLTAQRAAENTVQEHLFTLQRAADAAQAITWHQTLEKTMQEVVDQARGVIGVNQAFVSLAGIAGAVPATMALSVSESHASLWSLQNLPDFGAIFAPVLVNNRSMRLTPAEVQELSPNRYDENSVPASSNLPPMRGCMAVPLLGRSGKNIGILQLSDKYEGNFTQQDEYVAMELARLAAVAMENARLIDEVNELNLNLEHKVAERTAALSRQEALFRALAQQAPEVVWTANPKGQATFMNQAWFALMGGAFDDWSGTQWFSAVHPEDLPAVRANWQLATRGRTPFAGVRRFLAKDGSQHTMSYRASPVLDDQGEVTFWVGIDTDITEIKTIEAELRLSNQELEAFSYSVSHDLRSPLNTIDGFSRLLAKQINSESGEKAAHYLSRIHAGVAQMGQLIEDMLSLAQVSRVQLRHESIDLSTMARNVIEALRVRDPAREVAVTIESDLQAFGDARLVRQVLENLLGNAWKFSSKRAGATIAVGHSMDPAGQLVFFVRDNGVGFDMAYSDKLFRAFQRLHTADEFPGSGIGLATVNRIIARHGGDLWAESISGMGATFFFSLPKFPAPA